ncbi:putative receptor protein kinase ZmPK1 [Cryptomeria japonica]|uniref:putative receptor protein kinase ZmPK1 n=1 Tax=Cryptomeria japonica TaxID=3369 RepID=UPI0027DA41C8|nr:putative receptor protein kinase ZmPK1 [Cryptomeria japonica]
MECAAWKNSVRFVLRLWLASVLICIPFVVGQDTNGLDGLRLGYYSPSPQESETILISPDGTFSAGFYNVGINAYGLAVWYSLTPKTVVWMANRDQPVNGQDSSLRFQIDGDLLLVDAGGIPIWRTNTKAVGVKEALLLNTGNLVLRSDSEQIVWQSFDFPTDTLLPEQIFKRSSNLTSRMELGNYKPGYYRFYFNDDNYLALIYEGLKLSSKYWPSQPNYAFGVFDIGRTTYNITRQAFLDRAGRFTSSDKFSFNAYDYGEGPLRRLTLDIDGNLRLYSLDSQNLTWEITWVALAKQCDVHGLCGFNGVCTYTPEPKCICPPGFEIEDSTDWFKGCRLIHNFSCALNSAQFLRLPYTDYYGYERPGQSYGVSLQVCRKICMDDCLCLGFVYTTTGTGECFPKYLLTSGLQSPKVARDTYIKISANDSSARNVSSMLMLIRSGSSQCSPEPRLQQQNTLSGVSKKGRSRIVTATASILTAIGVTEIVCIALGWGFLLQIFRSPSVHNYQGYSAVPGGLRRFKLSDLRRATKNFKDSVGKGGFGSVYKGLLLLDNKLVAVKRLEGVSQGEDEFRAELSMIGRVNHINLVQMLGYCAEGDQRLLVYEYVENGSLDNYLFTQDSSRILDWNKRFQIAVDTAKGLAYLHEDCLEWILHCDIKPENILLDKHFHAKVSDFGLSKLVDNGNENDRKISALAFSKIRGTRGYLAPEWTMNFPITAKADVYSFGILLLELVSGRKGAEFNVAGSNFVQWAFDNVRENRWRENLVDPKLGGSDMEWKPMVEMERVLKTALLCIEQDKNKRPSMSRVVEILMLPINTDDSDLQLEMDTDIAR